jgi:hypothetical protein
MSFWELVGAVGVEEDDEDLIYYASFNLAGMKDPVPRPLRSGYINLSGLNDDQCKVYFRFTLPELHQVILSMSWPNQFILPRDKGGYRVSTLEALAIVCNRLAFPVRLYSMAEFFGRSMSALSSIFIFTIDALNHDCSHVLDFDFARLQQRLQYFSNCISNAGAPLENCWGFIDGTARPCNRPAWSQDVLYSGHKRIHCIKFQSLLTPDGIIASLYGPVEGRHHDLFLLRESHLTDILNMSRFHDYVIYGDPGYQILDSIVCY